MHLCVGGLVEYFLSTGDGVGSGLLCGWLSFLLLAGSTTRYYTEVHFKLQTTAALREGGDDATVCLGAESALITLRLVW